jgi:hypothetical protein
MSPLQQHHLLGIDSPNGMYNLPQKHALGELKHNIDINTLFVTFFGIHCEIVT